MEILLALIDGIIEILPELIPTVTLVCWSIGRAIIDNLPQIIQMGVNLLLALVDGFLGASDVIMEMAPQMIETLVKGLIESIPILLEGAWKLVQALWKYFTETNWAQLGIDIMVALANGVIKGLNTLIGKLNQFDIDVPDWVPIIGGKNVSFKLPTLSLIHI